MDRTLFPEEIIKIAVITFHLRPMVEALGHDLFDQRGREEGSDELVYFSWLKVFDTGKHFAQGMATLCQDGPGIKPFGYLIRIEPARLLPLAAGCLQPFQAVLADLLPERVHQMMDLDIAHQGSLLYRGHPGDRPSQDGILQL